MADIFTETTQKLIRDEIEIQSGFLRIIAAGWDVESFDAIQEIVDRGGGPRYFPVGTIIKVASKNYTWVYFVVVAHDHHKCPEDDSIHTMTVMQLSVIYSRPFDGPEQLWYNSSDAAFAAGTYNIVAVKSSYSQSTAEDGTFQIVTTKDIPVGGKIRHTTMGAWRSSYSKDSVLAGKWITYDADDNIIESNLACTEGSEGTNLGTVSVAASNIVNVIGTFNSTQCNAYGSNIWGLCGVRQWLNADSTGWWKKQHIFDLAPSYSGINGYLGDLDPAFVAILGEVEVTQKRNTVYAVDGQISSYETTRDKVFLPSMTELNYGNNDGYAEGSVLEFYKGAGNTDRIKYDISNTGTARYWWMRSPIPWYATGVRYVYPDGSLNSSYASDGNGVAPACVIYKPKPKTAV